MFALGAKPPVCHFLLQAGRGKTKMSMFIWMTSLWSRWGGAFDTVKTMITEASWQLQLQNTQPFCTISRHGMSEIGCMV